MPGCGAAANAPLLRSKPGKSSTSYAAAHTGPDNWSAPSTCFKTANSAPPRKDEKGSLKREQQLSEVAPARQPPTCLRRRDACCVDIPEPVLAVPSGAEKSLRFFFFGDRDSKVQATVYDMPGRDVVVLRRRVPVRAGSAGGCSARFPEDVPGGSCFPGACDHTADASTRCRIGESHHQIGGAGIGQRIERAVPQNGSVDDEYFFVHSLTELDLAAGGTQFLDPFSVTIGPDSITLFVDGPRVDDDPYTCPHAFSEHCRPLLHRTWIEEGAIEFDVRGRSSDVPSHCIRDLIRRKKCGSPEFFLGELGELGRLTDGDELVGGYHLRVGFEVIDHDAGLAALR